MPRAATNPKSKTTVLATILIRSGLVLLTLGVLLLFAIYLPVLWVETTYELNQARSRITGPVSPIQEPREPVDADFGIVIPKLGANARIVPNVDPYNSREYQRALTKGVAHAKGTVIPGQLGNSFIFSHSSANFYEATRFNSVFYLLSKLDVGDEIDIYVHKQKFTFAVSGKKIVDASAVSYLSAKATEPTLTLMTCWPPGTTFKRLLVIAERKVDE